MAVIRVNKTNDYTVMSNYHLKDKRLTLKAKGLLSLILSLPDNWNYTVGGLVAICLEKESAVKSALNELKKYGYLRIDKIKPTKENGGRYEYIYNIFEQPQEQQEEEKQGEESQEVEKQGVEKQGVENQPLEIQPLENRPLYKDTNISNTNKLNTNKLNTKKTINKKIDYEHIKDMYNDTCVSFPKAKSLSDDRKKAIKARLNKYTIEQMKEMFEKAEKSDFLKGSNTRNWQANFDWLMKDSNFAKVLDGNYDNRKTKQEEKGNGDTFKLVDNLGLNL